MPISATAPQGGTIYSC